jgi:integrase
VPRKLREAEITTPTARRKLPAGEYRRRIDAKVHLCYYRTGQRDGRWQVRWRDNSGRYHEETFAAADDVRVADGSDVLSFDQAERRARDVVGKRQAEAKAKAKAEVAATAAAAEGPPVTVRLAVEEYLVERDAREEKSFGATETRFRKRDARSRLSKHVLDTGNKIADKLLKELSERNLIDWRDGLQLAPPTKQRLVNDFRAALNRAALRYRAQLPPEIDIIIKHGFRSTEPPDDVAREIQVLQDTEVRRIVKAAQEIDAENADWNGGLYRLVLTLAATGMRFSQVIRLTVADVQSDRNRLMVPTSRKGKRTKPAKRFTLPVGEDVIAALQPAIAGRKGSETLLLRPKWKQTGADRWQIIGREPWHVASELRRPWAAILKRTGLSSHVIAYALRHSSIVRAIRSGLPIRLVAALHDTSVAVIERHYAAFITDALDELASRAVVPLAPTESTADVVQFPRRAQ